MFGKYFSKKEDNFYLPGEEIKIGKSCSFMNYTCAKDPLSVCKNRVAFAMLAFLLVFSIISIRLFEVCVAPNLRVSEPETSSHLRAFAQNPIKRADISAACSAYKDAEQCSKRYDQSYNSSHFFHIMYLTDLL